VTLEKQVISGLKWSAAAKLLTQVIAWAVTLLVIRLLVPGDYGLMAMSAVVISIFAGVAELGFGASLVQARDPTRDDFARVGGALIILNAACVVLVCVTAPGVARLFDQPRLELVLQVASAQFLLSAFAAIPEALAYRQLRFKWLAATDIVAGLGASALTLVLALKGAGVWALVISNLVGYLIRTLMLAVGGGVVRPTFRLRGIGQFVRFGGAWSGARFVWQLTYQSDVIVAGRFLSQEAVGIYSVAVQLANLPLGKVMGLVNRVAFPAIARLQGDMSRIKGSLLDSTRLLALAVIPMLWGISAVAEEFVDVALGAKWHSVILPLQLIALATPLRMFSTLFATAVSSIGRADIELVNTLVSLATSVVAFVVGVQWGIRGLAIAYVVATAVGFILNFPRTARLLGISSRDLVGACVTSVISGIVMLFATATARLALESVTDWVRFCALALTGAVVYVGTLSIIDRRVFADARRVAYALRGTA
jgi:O-antigen/teichoic acid export membrane protein